MFAKEGAKGVVLVSRTQTKLEDVAKEIEVGGGKAVVLAGDVTVEETSQKMIDLAEQAYGQIDAVFLNAGSISPKSIVELTSEDIDSTFNSNFKSVVYGLKYSLPAMAKSPNNGSVIVNTSAMGSVARANVTGVSMYSAAKAAADMLVKCAACEAAADGTRVNAVAPGVIATNIMGMDEAGTNNFAKDLHLNGRAGKSEEVASVVTMLASEAGSLMTGSIVTVDGGWSLKA